MCYIYACGNACVTYISSLSISEGKTYVINSKEKRTTHELLCEILFWFTICLSHFSIPTLWPESILSKTIFLNNFTNKLNFSTVWVETVTLVFLFVFVFYFFFGFFCYLNKWNYCIVLETTDNYVIKSNCWNIGISLFRMMCRIFWDLFSLTKF